MGSSLYKQSLIGSATITNKSENQDSSAIVQTGSLNVLVVCDGLGSYQYAKLSSERVADFFSSFAKGLTGKITNVKLAELYRAAKQKLVEFSEEFSPINPESQQQRFGTTAITVIETDAAIKVAYAGNGSIWHIRGNFTEFPSSYLFPWCVSNLLNPHTIPENGKEALYRLISDSGDMRECSPTVLEVQKDDEYGDIIMICTDGIYSSDQVTAGKNEKGVWLKYEPSMLVFFERLKDFFKSNTVYNEEHLQSCLNRYLLEMKQCLDDDATIAVLITPKVLNYQNELNWLKDEESRYNPLSK